jgi:hypothetical protein
VDFFGISKYVRFLLFCIISDTYFKLEVWQRYEREYVSLYSNLASMGTDVIHFAKSPPAVGSTRYVFSPNFNKNPLNVPPTSAILI